VKATAGLDYTESSISPPTLGKPVDTVVAKLFTGRLPFLAPNNVKMPKELAIDDKTSQQSVHSFLSNPAHTKAEPETWLKAHCLKFLFFHTISLTNA